MRASVRLVPVLQRGSHAGPRDGACLMELVSTLPCGTWTSSPTKTDPTIALLARSVNDLLPKDSRQELLGMAVWLAGETGGGIVPTAYDTARVCVQAAAGLGCHVSPGILRSTIGSVADGGNGPGGFWEIRRQRRAVRHAVALIRQTPQWTTSLVTLLVDVVNAARASADLPPVSTLGDRPTERALPVRSVLRVAGEYTELWVQAMVNDWPQWLNDDWAARRRELAQIQEKTLVGDAGFESLAYES